MIDLLERYGKLLGMPYSKKITSNLYELRVRGKVEARILYGFKSGSIVFLHAFKKKKDKISQKEIQLAARRFSGLE